jgi:hypothetical protein
MTAHSRKAAEMKITKRLVLVCACALIAIPVCAQAPAAAAAAQRTFSSPEDAVTTLIATVKKSDVDALLTIFGEDGKDLLASSDPATARMNRQVFAVAAAEKWRLADEGANRKTLVIGNEDWPFPVPLVKDAAGWRFDTAAGKEEVIARRIGRNELAVIDNARAYVSAQHRYAAKGHDGNQPGVYATKFQSDPGKENGLYWPTTRGQARSPLGDLVAQAAEDDHRVGPDPSQPSPFHGYYFKIIPAAGGFGLVAWPSQYDVTGVMTFIVNQDGIVREKDLGAQTDAAARKMAAYKADASWKQVR